MSTYKRVQKSQSSRFFGMEIRSLKTKKMQGRWLFSAMNQMGQFLLVAAMGGHKLRIWQTADRDGNSWWHGFDPFTGSSTLAATDDEMRAWIDRHYYQ